MKKFSGYTLAEVMVTLIVISFIAVLTLPSIIVSKAEKTYTKGYQKAYDTLNTITEKYLKEPTGYIVASQFSAAKFIQYFASNTNIKGLYAEAEPTPASTSFAALKFKDTNFTVGAKNPVTTSGDIELSINPTFWIVTEDNIAYSVVLPGNAQCDEKLNINTLTNLSDTMQKSCFAVIVDVNGVFTKPNKLDTLDDVAPLESIPHIKNDRYFIFMANDGITAGNPNHIYAAKVFATK